MALTASTMLALGTEAPDFDLPSVTGGEGVTLSSTEGEKGTLVAFVCAHCPFVVHVAEEIGRVWRDYGRLGLGMVGVCSNDADAYPADAPAGMARAAGEWGWEFPVLHDGSQDVAKAYTAACTPDFFLFDAGRSLVYRGQLDGSRPDNGIPLTGINLRLAIDALIEGREVDRNQQPSMGCNIKWRPGNEPAYART